MNKYKKIWIISSIFILALFSALYAAWTQISSLSQTVWEWDIITSAYYNALWALLWGSKSEWKFCKFTWWKILCIDNALWGWSTSSWGGSEPTPMQKVVFKSPNYPSTNESQDKENVDAWNALVSEVEEHWINVFWQDSDVLKKEWRWVPGWWVDTCLADYQTLTHKDYGNIQTREWCISNICEKKVWTTWVYSTVNCWTWSVSCPRWVWVLTCMY